MTQQIAKYDQENKNGKRLYQFSKRVGPDVSQTRDHSAASSEKDLEST